MEILENDKPSFWQIFMKHGPTPLSRSRIPSLVCLGLIFCEGILALLWIFSQPTDPDSAFLLGFSPVRWVLGGMVWALGGLAGALWLDLARGVERAWRQRITRSPAFPARLAAASLGVLVTDQAVLLLLAGSGEGALLAVFNRLLPPGVFLGLAALEILLAAILAVRERAWPDRGAMRPAGLVGAGLALAGGLILLTGVGLAPVTNGWYEYGVPLVNQQALGLLSGALLVLLAGLALAGRPVLLLRARPGVRKALFAAADVGLALGIWLAAVIVWSSLPVPNSWFSPRPFPPNYEVYPNSDALSYDVAAEGTLLGAAWSRGDVPYKPLYVAYLVLLHGAAGQDYTRVIFLQTLLLALFPAALYLLGSRLHSRLAGGLAALAVILREYNQLSVASLTTLSTSKLLLSELPTALGTSALLVVLVVWLDDPAPGKLLRRPHLALLAGGIIGLLAQVRLQTVLFLPALAAFLLLYIAPRWRPWLGAAGLAGLGFCLSVAPLALRNWSASGTLALEKPGYFERTLAYSYNPVTGTEQPAGLETPGLPGVPERGLGKTIELALHHFTHNTVSALLALPGGPGNGPGWTQIADLQSLFWMDERAEVSLPGAGWMVANLALAALGVGVLWHRARWAGLLPALFFGVYNLSSALGGFSGQRFILPVDWAAAFYFSAGLAWLAAALLGLAGWDVNERLPYLTRLARPAAATSTTRRGAGWKTGAVAGILLLTGGLLPLEEAFIPARYPALDASQAQAELERLAETRLPSEEQAALRALLDQPGSEVLHGVALYPRAIQSREAEAGLYRYAGEHTYPLLAYVYLGADQLWVLQPLERVAGVRLPNSSEVLVAGKRVDNSFQAFATAELNGDGFIFHRTTGR